MIKRGYAKYWYCSDLCILDWKNINLGKNHLIEMNLSLFYIHIC